MYIPCSRKLFCIIIQDIYTFISRLYQIEKNLIHFSEYFMKKLMLLSHSMTIASMFPLTFVIHKKYLIYVLLI